MKPIPLRSVALFLVLILLLLCSSKVTEGARQGLLLWYTSVVPALFPFMVLSGLIVSGGGLNQIMRPFHIVLHPTLGLSNEGCYVLISGLLCGYPMGAKICTEFVSEGRISLREARFLMVICNHPSPMFILGYLYPYFSDQISIPLLLISVYTPILVLAVIAKRIYSFHTAPNNTQFRQQDSESPLDLNASILSSIEILCKIGGYLVMFSIAVVFVRNASQIPSIIKLCLISILEMTVGIKEWGTYCNHTIGYIAAIATLTFGGISGIFQTKGILENKKRTGLSIRSYIVWKSAHALLSTVLAYLLCNR